MNEIQEYKFRTKTGFCTITSQQIILERQGVRGEVANTVFGSGIRGALAIYTVLGIAALAFGALLYFQGSPVSGVVYSLLGLIFLWNAYASRNNSAAPVIERSAIQSVDAHPPRPPFTRGYFSVWFMENGRKRRRLIMLPGSFSGGGDEYQKALNMLQEAGLLK
jgi:hypothetical protein